MGCPFVFYDRFVELCEQKGVKPSRAAVDAGITKSAVTYWKQSGAEPTGDNVKKLCDYFGVSRSVLFDDIKKEPAIPEDDELLRKINSRPKVKELVTLLVEMDDDQLAAFLKLFSRP